MPPLVVEVLPGVDAGAGVAGALGWGERFTRASIVRARIFMGGLGFSGSFGCAASGAEGCGITGFPGSLGGDGGFAAPDPLCPCGNGGVGIGLGAVGSVAGISLNRA